MTRQTQADIDAALEATWPPALRWQIGSVTLRDGQGGGKRVSAATCEDTIANLEDAEQQMRQAGRAPLFRVRPHERDLDRALEARGYRIVDPTRYYCANIDTLLKPEQRPLDAVASETRLGIADEIWALGGIGPERLAIMERVTGPRAFLLARLDDRTAGTGFVALHHDIAMVHALEVRTSSRRRGAGRAMLHRAAKWAAGLGATRVALAVTESNTGANTLYRALGMQACGGYHYREQGMDHQL